MKKFLAKNNNPPDIYPIHEYGFPDTDKEPDSVINTLMEYPKVVPITFIKQPEINLPFVKPIIKPKKNTAPIYQNPITITKPNTNPITVPKPNANPITIPKPNTNTIILPGINPNIPAINPNIPAINTNIPAINPPVIKPNTPPKLKLINNIKEIYLTSEKNLDNILLKYKVDINQYTLNQKRYLTVYHLYDNNLIDTTEIDKYGIVEVQEALQEANSYDDFMLKLKPIIYTVKNIYAYTEANLNEFLFNLGIDYDLYNINSKRYLTMHHLYENNLLDTTEMDKYGIEKFQNALKTAPTYKDFLVLLETPDKPQEEPEELGECCACGDKMPKNNALKCGHFICKTCVTNLDKPECPVCRDLLAGPTIDQDVLMKINQNTNRDKELADDWLAKILFSIERINQKAGRDVIYIRDIGQHKLQEGYDKYYYDPNEWYNLTPDQYRDLYNFIDTNNYIPKFKDIVK